VGTRKKQIRKGSVFMIKQVVNKYDVPQGKIGINELTGPIIIAGKYYGDIVRLLQTGYSSYQWKTLDTLESRSATYDTIKRAVETFFCVSSKVYVMDTLKELGEFLTKDGNIGLQASDLKRGTKVRIIAKSNQSSFNIGDIVTIASSYGDTDSTILCQNNHDAQWLKINDLELYKEPQCGDKVILLSGHDNRWYGGKELTFRGQTWNDHIMLEDEDGHRDTTDMSNIKLAS
jgi:hypothetical protein